MTDFKRRRAQPAPEATQSYPTPTAPFQSTVPQNPDAQPVFTNEDAWLPDFSQEEQDIYPADFQNNGDALDEANIVPDTFDDLDDPTFDPDYLTEDELKELHQTRWQLLSSLGDFLGTILGAAIVLILVAMLVSLINWLISDVSQSLTLFQTMM